MTTPDPVEVAARALCVARGCNPDALHQNYFDIELVDGTLTNGKPGHLGWRHHVVPTLAQFAAIEAAGFRIVDQTAFFGMVTKANHSSASEAFDAARKWGSP